MIRGRLATVMGLLTLAQGNAALAAEDKPARVARCLDERFAEAPAPYRAVRLPAERTVSMILADDACLNTSPSACRNRVAMDKTHAWIAGAAAGGFVCVTDGARFGWTESAPLSFAAIPAAKTTDWVGEWERKEGGARITITLSADGKLHVGGDAEWQGNPDAPPHVGDLDATPRAVANELQIGDPICLDRERNGERPQCLDCVARLMLIGGTLLVTDNRMCGGMNVNFDGLYAHPAPAGGLASRTTPRKRRR